MRPRTIAGTFRPRISIRTLLVAIAAIAVVCSVVVRVWSDREYARRMSASNRLLEPIITYHLRMAGRTRDQHADDLDLSERIAKYHARMVVYYDDLLRKQYIELPPLPADLEAERRAIQNERRAAGYPQTYTFEEPPRSMQR